MSTPLPESTTAAQSRAIFGTLTTLPANKFTGTEEETSAIIAVLKQQCSNISHLMLQAETHNDGGANHGNLHYHFLIRTSTAVRDAKLLSLRQAFAAYHPGRHDIVFAKSVTNVQSYIFKDHLLRQPITEGYSPEEIASFKKPKRTSKPATTVFNTNLQEGSLVKEVTAFFVKNNFKISSDTRKIHGRNGLDRHFIDDRSFYKLLAAETTIPTRYGAKGLALIALHIADIKSYVFPFFDTSTDYIGFTNLYYRFSTGKTVAVDDPSMASIIPICYYDISFPPPVPTAYLYLIKNHGWNREAFTARYGEMFRPKKHRTPCLYIWGPTRSGKSMLYHPLVDVFASRIGFFVPDGKYSCSQFAGKLVAILNETDIWGKGELTIDMTKLILEGADFLAARKGGQPELIKAIHAFVACNVAPPSGVDAAGEPDMNVEAVLNRIDSYETRKMENPDEYISVDRVVEQSPGWVVLCTQTEQYIPIPSEFL